MLLLLLMSSHQVDVEKLADVSEVDADIHISLILMVKETDTSETSATLPLCAHGVKTQEQDEQKYLKLFENTWI
jgi:hypothetical protein